MIVKHMVIPEYRSIMETILVRDQRTTSHRVLDHAAQSCAPTPMKLLSSQQRSNKPQNDVSSRYSEVAASRTGRSAHSRKYSRCLSYLLPAFYDDRGVRPSSNASVSATTWLRLGCLLVASTLVTPIHTAPYTMPLQERFKTSPKWVNPCGFHNLDNVSYSEEVLEDEQLLTQIIIAAKMASQKAERFRDEYVESTLKIDFDEAKKSWNHRYEWLPELNKKLLEHLPREYLDKVDFDKALVDSYEYMQKYAVGLEQIIADQEKNNLHFSKQFRDISDSLQAVLCELQVALAERAVNQRPDVVRDIMPDEQRDVTTDTERNLRDWIIFREYMNGMEYVVEVFEHIRCTLLVKRVSTDSAASTGMS